MFLDEYYIVVVVKCCGFGFVQFIGEFFKLGMLIECIMYECVCKLFEYQDFFDEVEIEFFIKLFRMIGGILDSIEKG